MPGKVKVKVLAGRNLPVMDRGSDTTDAFVEIKFGSITHKTDVCRKSLNPHWNNSEWYRFEVEDSELQDEPLQLRLMDHDTYSANDAIGKVVVSLAPLLAREPSPAPHRAPHNGAGAVMSGWIPVFDTMHGIRGELHIIVKVELFSDFNKFRQSSCGVQFFHCPKIPCGYHVAAIHGFVEELVVNDDPEYQWIDKIRTPRASNEARQVAFIKLSNQVQRRVGLKASELGANAVVGYSQAFDLQGEAGVVARAAATAVTLVRALPPPHLAPPHLALTSQTDTHPAVQHPSERSSSPRQHARTESVGAAANHAPAALVTTPLAGAGPPGTASAPIGMNRRSSDSDLSITPKGGSLTMTGGAILRPSMNPNNLEMLEYPFLTMDEFPPGFVIHIGGTVCARSVKLVERSEGAGGGEAAWWAELRTELRAHARALRCTAVLGYSEAATICEDVCILSASGTAAVINLEPSSFVPTTTLNGGTTLGTQKSTMSRADSESEHCPSASRKETQQTSHAHGLTQSNGDSHTEHTADADWSASVEDKPGCSVAHVPYNHQSMPYQADVTKCCVCRRSRVPRILICTVELPCSLATTGRGCLVTAAAARVRRAPPSGEPAARDLSDQLPFLEYELHRLLVAKLRVLGMNALFGLRVSVSAGERLVVALASGTAVLCNALPAPRAPRLVGQADAIAELQRALDQALATNRSVYELEPTPSTLTSDDSDDDLPNMELTGDKDACVLEVDDAEDMEMARALASGRAPRGVHAVSVRRAPHMASLGTPHAFTQLWRARVTPAPGGHAAAAAVARHVHRLMQSVYYKLRRLTPCVVCDIKFQLDLPEVDEIQLLVTGVALPLASEPLAPLAPLVRPHKSAGGMDELVFSLDDEDDTDRQRHQQEDKSHAIQRGGMRACGVAVTPLERVCGSRSQRHVSALRLLFVRETTSVRELGGISGFLHTFVMEVLAVARAYSTALGGNALSSFYITELMLQDNPHKNQGQCLLSVGGDVVYVTY